MKNLLFALFAGSVCCCYAQQNAAPAPELKLSLRRRPMPDAASSA